MSYCLSLSAYCSHCTISSITSSTDHLTWRRCRLRFFSATCPSLSQTRISIATNATLFRPTFANKYHGMFQAYLGAFTTLATPNLGFFIFKPYRSLLRIQLQLFHGQPIFVGPPPLPILSSEHQFPPKLHACRTIHLVTPIPLLWHPSTNPNSVSPALP